MTSSSASDLHFCHRPNRDGTVDSICLKCFLTVSRGQSDAVRMKREESHACNPHDLERLEGAKTPVNESKSSR